MKHSQAAVVLKPFALFCFQNFHLMDYHLATFITVMLARRLVWTIVSEVGVEAQG